MLTPRFPMGLGSVNLLPDPCSIDPTSAACNQATSDLLLASGSEVTVQDIAAATGAGVVNPTTGQVSTSTAIPSASVLQTGLQQSQLMTYALIGGAVLFVVVMASSRR